MDNQALSKKAETAVAEGNQQPVATKKKTNTSPAVLAKEMIEKRMPEIQKALPSVITPERFVRIATTAVSSNPKLASACMQSPTTFLGALMTAAQLGVEPNTPLGQAYLIPFNNKRNVNGTWVAVPEVSFQLGYQGIIDLVYRSGMIVNISARVVYEKDEFDFEYGLDPKLKHKPYKGNDRGEPVYFYATFKGKDGSYGFEVMSYEDVLDHAKRFSKSYDRKSNKFFGPWESDFNSMAKKTVLLAALKYAPKKSDFARAISADNTVKSNLSSDMSTVQSDEVIDVEAVNADEGNETKE